MGNWLTISLFAIIHFLRVIKLVLINLHESVHECLLFEGLIWNLTPMLEIIMRRCIVYTRHCRLWVSLIQIILLLLRGESLHCRSGLTVRASVRGWDCLRVHLRRNFRLDHAWFQRLVEKSLIFVVNHIWIWAHFKLNPLILAFSQTTRAHRRIDSIILAT